MSMSKDKRQEAQVYIAEKVHQGLADARFAIGQFVGKRTTVSRTTPLTTIIRLEDADIAFEVTVRTRF